MTFKNKIILLIASSVLWLVIECYYLRFTFLGGGLNSSQAFTQAFVTIVQLVLPISVILFAVTILDKNNMRQLQDDDDDSSIN